MQDNSLANAKSISTAGKDALPTPPATPLGELARNCLLNELRRLDAEAAARKLQTAAAKHAAMKRYRAPRKSSDSPGLA